MKINIEKIIRQRTSFPIGHRKNSEQDYIKHQLGQDENLSFFVTPKITLQSVREKESIELIFKNNYIVGLFDISYVWKPYASVEFVLLVVSKEKNNHFYLGEYIGDETYTYKDKTKHLTGEVTLGKPSDSFSAYLIHIEQLLEGNGKPVENKNFRTWSVNTNRFHKERLTVNFYDPKYSEEVGKLQKEDTVLLGELADLLKPRKVKGDKKHLVIKTKDFNYPLDIEKLEREEKTTLQIKEGDILLSESFSGIRKYFLVPNTPKESIYVSAFLTVIRTKNKRVTPEYLFLYLQSQTIKKYLNMYATANFFSTVKKSDLINIPVIVPEEVTLSKSAEIFKSNYLDKSKSDIVKQINLSLYDKIHPQKPIQKEFLQEELDNLRVWKKEIINKLLQEDLRELRKCKKERLYKSFLIISGSILEAFLLDWLSEIDNKDYFSSKDDSFTLGQLIWRKLNKLSPDIIDKTTISKADSIRKHRNLIHPKEYFNSTKHIDDTVCNEIIKDLQVIFAKRK